MATYNEIYNIWATGSTLKNKVIVACVQAASTVFNENANTASHAERIVWANQVLADPTKQAQRMLWGVCLNASVQSAGEAVADATLQTVVDNLVTFFALH